MELPCFPARTLSLLSSPVRSSRNAGQIATARPLLSLPCRLAKRLPVRASVAGFKPTHRRSQHSRRLCASSGGVPSESELSEEDSKFVPLNDDDPSFGPPALLLLGFEADEILKIQEFLKGLDGDFLKVILCTEEMIKQTLWDAFQTEQQNLAAVKIAKSLPRVCIFSGLSGEEMMMFIDAFPESGLESPVFAALVPNSADKLLEEVIAEIMGDHEMLTGNKSD